MRWPHESAITRRDEYLVRTRRLSAWIAGGATAASVGLAAALGFALPGHTVTAGTQSAGQTSSGSGQGSGSGRPSGQGTGHRTRTGHHHRRLSPPRQAPVNTGAPPVVSSGGS
jgi:hypothetical protein